MDMTKKCFIVIAAVLILFAATACSGSRKAGNGAVIERVVYIQTSVPDDAEMRISFDGKKDIRLIKAKHFNAICNHGVGRIRLKYGNKCKVEVCGNAMALKHAAECISMDNDALVLKKSLDIYDTDAEYIIYCPEINMITNKGRLSVYADDITTDKLEIINSGCIKGTFGSLKCRNILSIDNMGQCENLSFKTINARDISIYNTGILGTDTEKIQCTALKLTNKGQQKLNGNINSANTVLSNIGVLGYDATVSGNELKISNKGQTKIKTTFKGNKVYVENTGVGNIELDVNCEMLTAKNNGHCNLDISGTADSTVVTGNGISRINTHRLNKF